MRKIVTALVFSGAMCAGAQSSRLAMCYNTDAAAWVPVAAIIGGSGQVGAPASAALYGLNGSTYYPLLCDASGHLIPGSGVTFGTTLPSSGTEGDTFVGTGNNLYPSGVSAYYHSGAWWLPSDVFTVTLPATLPATTELFVGDLQTTSFLVESQGTLAHLTVDLRDISGPSLAFAIATDSALASASFPNLRNITGAASYVTITDSSGTITSLSFPKITDISGAGAYISLDQAHVTSLTFPLLADISGAGAHIATTSLGSITSLSLTALTDISGDGAYFSVSGSTALTSFTVPALTALSGGDGAGISVGGNALPVSNVNALLAQMVSIGASGDFLGLDSQTPAAPPTGPVGASNLTIDTSATEGASYPDSFTWALDAVCSGTQASGTGTAVAGVPATVTLVVAGVGCPASTNAPTTTGGAGTGLALAFNTANMDILLGRSWTVSTDVKAW